MTLLQKEYTHILKKIGLVVKVDDNVRDKADEFEKWLKSKDITIVRKKSSQPNRKLSGEKKSFAPPDLFCVFKFQHRQRK